eukprot:2579665-Pyramimonas_sp.AAC.1
MLESVAASTALHDVERQAVRGTRLGLAAGLGAGEAEHAIAPGQQRLRRSAALAASCNRSCDAAAQPLSPAGPPSRTSSGNL